MAGCTLSGTSGVALQVKYLGRGFRSQSFYSWLSAARAEAKDHRIDHGTLFRLSLSSPWGMDFTGDFH